MTTLEIVEALVILMMVDRWNQPQLSAGSGFKETARDQ